MHDGIPFGSFVLNRKLASGGMAEVFLAREREAGTSLPPLFALKRLHPQFSADPEFLRTFLDEARISSHLRHPNVVNIYDLGQDDGSFYLVMEYVDGVSFAQLMKAARGQGKKCPWEVAAIVGSKLCEGLEYVHSLTDAKGAPLHLIHRDVSPSNVMVEFAGDVKLIDFGIAKASVRTSHTVPGTLKANLSCAAPERFSNGEIDVRADVYGVGVCLYGLLAGRLPFEATDPTSLVSAVLFKEPPSLGSIRPDIPKPFADLIHVVLSKVAGLRPQTAGELQRRIAECAPDAGTTSATERTRQYLDGLGLRSSLGAPSAPARGSTAELPGLPGDAPRGPVPTGMNVTLEERAGPGQAEQPSGPRPQLPTELDIMLPEHTGSGPGQLLSGPNPLPTELVIMLPEHTGPHRGQLPSGSQPLPTEMVTRPERAGAGQRPKHSPRTKARREDTRLWRGPPDPVRWALFAGGATACAIAIALAIAAVPGPDRRAPSAARRTDPAPAPKAAPAPEPQAVAAPEPLAALAPEPLAALAPEAPAPGAQEAPEPAPKSPAVVSLPAKRRVVAGTGKLLIRTVPWADVWIDGRVVGRTPLPALTLLEGRHEIVARNGDLRAVRDRTVVVRSGQSLEIKIRLDD